MDAPGTPKETILKLQEEYGLSVFDIAKAISMTPKTIYAILNGEIPDPTTDFALLSYYLQLKIGREGGHCVREPQSIYEVISQYRVTRKAGNPWAY